MARKIEFEIDIDTNLKSVEDLKKEIKALEEEFETVSIGSEKFETLGNQIKKVRGQLKDIDLQFEALDREQRAAALVDTFSGLAGAIGAVSGAFIAFGAESEAIEEAEKKLLGIIAVVQGIREVSDAYVASIKLFGPALSGLGKSFKAAFTTANGAINSTKVALASLGIGLVILAVDQLIQNWDKLTEALGFTNDEYAEINKQLLEAEASTLGNVYALEQYNAIVQDDTRSIDERSAALEFMNKQGVATEDIDLANAESLQLLNERTAQSIKLIQARAAEQVAANILQDALQKRLEAENSTLEDNIDWWDKTKAFVLGATSAYGTVGYTIEKVKIGAENYGEALTKANEDVNRATEIYQKTLDDLIALEGENVEVQKTVRQNLERRAKTEAGVRQAIDDRAKASERAVEIAKQAALDLAILNAAEDEREIVRIRQNYTERLNLIKLKFGEESEEYKALMTLMNAEIADIEARQKKDKEAKDKEDADKRTALLTEIADAEAVTAEQKYQRQLQLNKEYYDQLIQQAKDAGEDTEALIEAQKQSEEMIREEYNAKSLETEKTYRDNLVQLATDSALSLISDLKSLNQIFDKDSEEAARKSFNREKALSSVETLISTYLAAQKAYASQMTLTPDAPIRASIAAGVALASGLARLAVINKQQFKPTGTANASGATGGGAGGTYTGGTGAPGGILPATFGTNQGIFGNAPGQIPAPQTAQQPLRAYVLAGDVTSAQEANSVIKRRRKL